MHQRDQIICLLYENFIITIDYILRVALNELQRFYRCLKMFAVRVNVCIKSEGTSSMELCTHTLSSSIVYTFLITTRDRRSLSFYSIECIVTVKKKRVEFSQSILMFCANISLTYFAARFTASTI